MNYRLPILRSKKDEIRGSVRNNLQGKLRKDRRKDEMIFNKTMIDDDKNFEKSFEHFQSGIYLVYLTKVFYWFQIKTSTPPLGGLSIKGEVSVFLPPSEILVVRKIVEKTRLRC